MGRRGTVGDLWSLLPPGGMPEERERVTCLKA